PDDGDPACHRGPLGTHAGGEARPAAQPDLRAAHPLPGVLPRVRGGAGAARLRLPVGGRLMLTLTRSHPKGLGDLLQYAALVDDGVCLLKDGAFLAAWSYAGPDMDSASHEELAVLSSQVNSALARLGNGWMLHLDAIREPSVGYPEGGAFPDPTTRIIDEERRGQYTAEGAHYESRYRLALTYRPPADVEARLSALFFEGDREVRRGWAHLLEIFQKTVAAVEDALSARLALSRLESAALLTYLHTCITGLRHPVRVPTLP